jgi:hypothetical protein
VPGNDIDISKIPEMFLSKDREIILGALQIMMWVQGQRLQMGLEAEATDRLLSSKVSALMNSMFSNAIRIAKLVDPRESDRALIQVGVQVNNAGPPTSNELVARAFRDLERRGWAREEITIDAVEQHIAGQLLAGPPTNDD